MERKWPEAFVAADFEPAPQHVETAVSGSINANAEEHALGEWRRNAADIVSFASALLHLPLIILVGAGRWNCAWTTALH
jgi:hypothetical protein